LLIATPSFHALNYWSFSAISAAAALLFYAIETRRSPRHDNYHYIFDLIPGIFFADIIYRRRISSFDIFAAQYFHRLSISDLFLFTYQSFHHISHQFVRAAAASFSSAPNREPPIETLTPPNTSDTPRLRDATSRRSAAARRRHDYREEAIIAAVFSADSLPPSRLLLPTAWRPPFFG